MIELKKAVSTLFLILYLLSILSLREWKISVKGSPDVIHVGIPTGYSTIQEAINIATPGDTIFVHNGTYYEDIVINKSVSLIGENRDLTIIYGGYKAIYVVSIAADDVNIEGFTIKKVGLVPFISGIAVVSRGGNIIHNNKIADIYKGLVIIYSANNVVSGNIISDNYYGVSLYSSSNNVFSGNIISDNYYGVSLYFYSNGNMFFHNNFHDAVQASSDSVSVWNYSNEGNYWTNYTGQDLNSDGIGDEPYPINADNQDDYPLMGIFSDFNVILKSKVYHVTFICNSTVSDFSFKIGEETGNKIIRFNVTGEDDTVGFCRVKIPTELMNYPIIILGGEEEIIPTLLGISNETYVYLYFTYIHSIQTITLISSKTLHLYNELLDKYLRLQMDLYNLNFTYYDLLSNYAAFLGNYSQLQQSYLALNFSYQEHLLSYSENVRNFRNLAYIFAATTAIFLITTIYLSRRAHRGITTKTTVVEDDR